MGEKIFTTILKYKTIIIIINCSFLHKYILFTKITLGMTPTAFYINDNVYNVVIIL